MSNKNKSTDVLVWQQQYNLLFNFIYNLADAGDLKALETLRTVAQLESALIVDNLNDHLNQVLRSIGEMNEAWGEKGITDPRGKQATSDLGFLSNYVMALIEGSDAPCPSCSCIGNMDPLCETCGGSGKLPVIRYVMVDSIPPLDEAGKLSLISTDAAYEFGIWTPWAKVICFDCDTSGKFRKPIPQSLEETNALTRCDHCDKMIQVTTGIAKEHNLALALQEAGLDAHMAQTGGMCSAVGVNLINGNSYMLALEEVDYNKFFISEFDSEGEWIEDSDVRLAVFESQQDAVDFLIASDLVRKRVTCEQKI